MIWEKKNIFFLQIIRPCYVLKEYKDKNKELNSNWCSNQEEEKFVNYKKGVDIREVFLKWDQIEDVFLDLSIF